MASMARPRRVLCRVPGATYRDRRNTRNGKKCSPLEPATPLLRSFARVCARAVDASIRTKYVLASMKGSVQVCVCVWCGGSARPSMPHTQRWRWNLHLARAESGSETASVTECLHRRASSQCRVRPRG